jgi:plastocyanin
MNKTFSVVLVLVIVVLGGYFLIKNSAQAPSDQALNPIESVTGESKTIIYSETGYAPAALAIKVGDTVVFKNESAKNMWPASAMHPTHTAYSGTTLSEHCPDLANNTFDACQGIAPGQSWSFTFEKIGEWKYHDHLTPSYFGKITVE